VLLYTESLGGAADSDAEHIVLLEACRSGDVDLAITLLRSHLSGASDAVIGFLNETATTGKEQV